MLGGRGCLLDLDWPAEAHKFKAILVSTNFTMIFLCSVMAYYTSWKHNQGITEFVQYPFRFLVGGSSKWDFSVLFILSKKHTCRFKPSLVRERNGLLQRSPMPLSLFTKMEFVIPKWNSNLVFLIIKTMSLDAQNQ